jgi:hypothetical protein
VHAKDPQHDALTSTASLVPSRVRWSTPVDLHPQYSSGGVLYIHYGSPVITGTNTVLVPQKTGTTGGFAVNAFTASSGTQLWSFATDFVLPTHNWTPPMGICLTGGDKFVAIPGAGGTVLVRSAPNSARGSVTRVAFYGMSNYNTNPTAFNSAIQICTPLTCDGGQSLYFGYVSNGAALPGYPNGIPSGLAKVTLSGVGLFVSARTLANDTNIQKVAYNCTPALTTNLTTLYVAVNQSNFSYGYLCKVNTQTLARMAHVRLRDPRNSSWDAAVPDDGTAAPTIGPDGDVYYGVLEYNFPSNNARGWMLHFNGNLTTTKTPGAFGWDDAASIVPASLVPSYVGSSSYLILTKYNNYAGVGSGDGQNRVAVLDPNGTETDPVTNAIVMREVITVVGPTKNPNLQGVDEWCINSAAIDSTNGRAIINSEDGHVYTWYFNGNTLSPGLKLAPATGEAYTMTLIGPDGAVYAINNAVLNCCDAGTTNTPPGTGNPPTGTGNAPPGQGNTPPHQGNDRPRPYINRSSLLIIPEGIYGGAIFGAAAAAFCLQRAICAVRRARSRSGSFRSG